MQKVIESDRHGGYLLSRLARVEDLRRTNRNLRWPDQYANPANPHFHETVTGPEIAAQVRDLAAVFVAVSTGGTAAGIRCHLERHVPSAVVVPVDVHRYRETIFDDGWLGRAGLLDDVAAWIASARSRGLRFVDGAA